MNVVIIGSGVMATGIAQVLLNSEEVVLVTVIARTITKTKNIRNSCQKHLSRLVRKGVLTSVQADSNINKLRLSADYQAITESSLVIEAVSENLEVKFDIFKAIKPYVNSKTIISSNTSSLSITAFAAIFDNPENMVGLHFFNPAPVMELVEIVVGHVTSNSVVDELVSFTKTLRKLPVVVNEAPGFVVNRMLIPMINEAVSILAEGVASAEDIDKAMKFGAHHPMGPLALADLIGNDVNLSIMETLYSETGDPKYRAHPLLRKMVRANHLGRKSKKGFFEY
jgi:3-hydroxybutyryl-CoA dehydrogenase